jgi:signal transduction histidine kinase
VERNALADSYCLCVRGNGVALPPDDLERVFESFFPMGAYSAEGPAIGLAIARRIGQHCRGRVWAESEPDHGTCFSFLLPRELGTDPREAANEPGQERENTGGRGQ